jgi:chemotaxis signal transduction protein
MSAGYLMVRAQGEPYGLPIGQVLEVSDWGEALDVPRSHPAVRGLTPCRGRLVPLIHLGALLAGRSAPDARGRTAVLVNLGQCHVALEVDDADEVVREAALPVSRGDDLPWASGVARHHETLVPILDLDALQDRIL